MTMTSSRAECLLCWWLRSKSSISPSTWVRFAASVGTRSMRSQHIAPRHKSFSKQTP
jgi:hypothetical protein